MTTEDKNKRILVIVIIVLLLVVGIFAGYNLSFASEKEEKLKVKINQIYSSDYDFVCFDNKYFIGSYEDKRIDVIIDGEGTEIYKDLGNIYYDGIYKMKDNRYLIYDNQEMTLLTYIFDGTKIEKFYEIKDVSYVKPIVYVGVDNQYILGFASMIDNNLYLYDLDSSGIIVLNDTAIVADKVDDNAYYIYDENYLVIKNNKELYGVVTLNGEEVIKPKYKDMISIGNGEFITLNKKNKYGILNKDGKKVIDFKYNVINKYDNYFVFVNSDNKMALYDNEYKKITGYEMEYNTLIDFNLRSDLNSIMLYKVNGKVAIVNNYLEDYNGTQYDKHTTYIIDGNKISKKINQIGFAYDNSVFSYDKKYNISVYNSDVSLLYKIKLEDANKIVNMGSLSDSIIYVTYIDLNGNEIIKYYDNDGKEYQFDLGKLFIKDVLYNGYIKEDNNIKTLTIYDLDNNELNSIYGNIITKYDKYLIVDSGIYRIEVEEN